MIKHREFIVPAVIEGPAGVHLALEAAFLFLSAWKERHKDYVTILGIQWVRMPRPPRPFAMVEIAYETDRDFDAYDDAQQVTKFESKEEADKPTAPEGIILSSGD